MNNKKLLLRFAVLVTAVMCALGASAYDFEYGGYYYNILTDSTVAITYKTYAGNSHKPDQCDDSKYGNPYWFTCFSKLHSTSVGCDGQKLLVL